MKLRLRTFRTYQARMGAIGSRDLDEVGERARGACDEMNVMGGCKTGVDFLIAGLPSLRGESSATRVGEIEGAAFRAERDCRKTTSVGSAQNAACRIGALLGQLAAEQVLEEKGLLISIPKREF